MQTLRQDVFMLLLVTFLFVLGTQQSLSAPPDDWSLQKVVDRAAVIVVARCERAMRVENTEFFPNHLGKYIIYMRVEATLRGEKERRLRVVHYQPLVNASKLGNGPSYMYFGPEVREACQRLWVGAASSDMSESGLSLLYLKAEDGGRYGPASGPSHASYSVIEYPEFSAGNQ